jgi:hypothetical protein
MWWPDGLLGAADQTQRITINAAAGSWPRSLAMKASPRNRVDFAATANYFLDGSVASPPERTSFATMSASTAMPPPGSTIYGLMSIDLIVA